QDDDAGRSVRLQQRRLVGVLESGLEVSLRRRREAAALDERLERPRVREGERPGRIRRRRGEQRSERAQEGDELGPLFAAPDEDVDGAAGLDDAPRLDERRDRIGGELEAVEARDDVERVVVVGKELDVADGEAADPNALLRDLDRRGGGVDAADVRGEAAEAARAAADVEQGRAAADAQPPNRVLVEGAVLRLLELGPVTRPRPPKIAVRRGRALGCLRSRHPHLASRLPGTSRRLDPKTGASEDAPASPVRAISVEWPAP